MKKKTTESKSWAQAVAEVTAKYGPMTVLSSHCDIEGEVTQERLRGLCGGGHSHNFGYRTVLLCNDKGITLRYERSEVKRRGRKYFTKTVCTLNPLRTYGNRCLIHPDGLSDSTLETLFDLFGVRCWRTRDGALKYRPEGSEYEQYIPEVSNLFTILAKRSGLLKEVLCGKVYSDETLHRRWASISYGISKVDWKTFRDYMLSDADRAWIPVGDIKAFTPDACVSMKEWLSRPDARGIMKDAVRDAVLDDGTVNLRHSTRRLTEDHLASVRVRMQKEIASKSQEPLFEKVPDLPQGISLLNSELEVFNEGLTMKHCIYTHYFRSIKEHRYLGFHMSSPQDCTFGVQIGATDRKPSLDQIYLSYDRPVKKDTRDAAQAFIDANGDSLASLLTTRTGAKTQRTQDDDQPF